MKRILIYAFALGIVIPIFGCPVCVQRIKDLQEPFFLAQLSQHPVKKIEVAHE